MAPMTATVSTVAYLHASRKEKEEGQQTKAQGQAKAVAEHLTMDQETRAAVIIGRAWRKRTRGDELNRKNLIERLLLEHSVCIGLTRLVLFAAIFSILIAVTGLGTSSQERRAVAELLTDHLDLEQFKETAQLSGVREQLKDLSSSLKSFSASGSEIFPDENAVLLIKAESKFVNPEAVRSAELAVTGRSFSISVWARDDSDAPSERPMVRKPLPANDEVSCWGWYYPASFRFGAHDYHSTSMDTEEFWEEVVVGSNDFPPAGTLSHLAIVVSEGKIFFYKDGAVLIEAGQTLPRNITECVGTVMLGESGLSLSSMKFYPRALDSNEIAEIIEAGQPLSEIATGSLLTELEANEAGALSTEVKSYVDSNARLVGDLDRSRTASDSITFGLLTETSTELDDALFLSDPSPPAALHPDDLSSWLPERELIAWTAGGGLRTTNDSLIVNQWMDDGTGAGTFWNVFDNPIYAQPSTADRSDPRGTNTEAYRPLTQMNLNGVPSNTEQLTFTWWVKAIRPTERFTMQFRIGGYGELDVLSYHMMSFGDACQTVSNPDTGANWFQAAALFMAANQVNGPLEEKYFMTAFNYDPIPTIWRHMAVIFNLKDGKHTSFIDGRKINEQTWQGVNNVPVSALTGKNLTISQVPWWNSDHLTKSKVAQFRMYPRALSQSQIQTIQNAATWPDGTSIKQCKERNDNSLQDTQNLDSQGRNCAWYSEMSQDHPRVCASAAAKTMCPLTCKGLPECSSGYPFDGAVHDDDSSSSVSATYRVWDRVMHLKPREGQSTIICPAKGQNKSQVVSMCRELAQTYSGRAQEEFATSFDQSWAGYDRADIRNCDVLEQRLDWDQCSWNDSWLASFKSDFAAKDQFSLSFWTKPVPTSRGMPREFVHAVNFFATLAPPRTLLDIREQNPYQEAISRMSIPSTNGHRWSSIRHRGTAGFEQGWSFYYASLKKLSNGNWEQCHALNGFPQQCSNFGAFGQTSGYLEIPEQFLAALEVTAEVLISPIEWSTDVLSTPEIQQRYYRNAPKMISVVGPSTPELQLQEVYQKVEEKEVQQFPERLLLAAPPIVFQVRSQGEPCESEAMRTFLSAQYQLVEAAHCPSPEMCPSVSGADDIYSCNNGKENEGSFYGISKSELLGNEVYPDFLYTMADNEIIVRQEQVLPTKEFLDTKTEEARILCLFHAPDTGDTTLLAISASFDGNAVEVDYGFTHYGFLDSDTMKTATILWSIFYTLCALTILLNCMLLVDLWREAKEFPEVGWAMSAVFEVAYDMFQVLVLIVFSAFKLIAQQKSEDRAKDLVNQFAAVPFRDPNETVKSKMDKFFVAIEQLQSYLDADQLMETIGFFIMILMLIRIINATAVHPRTGVLIGTLYNGLSDLWHFSILFMLVFVCFSLVATWKFGYREEFSTLRESMVAQFDMLLGGLPEGFQEDDLLIVYVTLVNIIQFFLMLNFLLAIVVESYMKVREIIDSYETETEITWDVITTIHFKFIGIASGWPGRRRIAKLLQHRVSVRNVCWTDFHVIGVPKKIAMSIIQSYMRLGCLGPKAFEPTIDLERIEKQTADAGDRAREASHSIKNLEDKIEKSHNALEYQIRELGQQIMTLSGQPRSTGAAPTAPPFDQSRLSPAARQFQSGSPKPVQSSAFPVRQTTNLKPPRDGFMEPTIPQAENFRTESPMHNLPPFSKGYTEFHAQQNPDSSTPPARPQSNFDDVLKPPRRQSVFDDFLENLGLSGSS